MVVKREGNNLDDDPYKRLEGEGGGEAEGRGQVKEGRRRKMGSGIKRRGYARVDED
jgi:hypothetical protein